MYLTCKKLFDQGPDADASDFRECWDIAQDYHEAVSRWGEDQYREPCERSGRQYDHASQSCFDPSGDDTDANDSSPNDTDYGSDYGSDDGSGEDDWSYDSGDPCGPGYSYDEFYETCIDQSARWECEDQGGTYDPLFGGCDGTDPQAVCERDGGDWEYDLETCYYAWDEPYDGDS